MKRIVVLSFVRVILVALLSILGEVAFPGVVGIALLSLSPASIHAQNVAGCENPPVDEPDGDGDECYVPPDPGKSLGPNSTDTNSSCDQAGQCAGDPINPATGNAYEVLNDYVGRGPFPLVLTRFYNSQSLANGSMGANWSHSYSANIVPLSPTVVLVVKNSQKILTFTLNGGAWISSANINSHLVQTASGWVYTTGDDNVETYDVTGKLLSIATRSGQTQTLNYDSHGRLADVRDSYGRALTFFYDDSNRVVKITNPAGRSYSYTYDAENNLASVTGPDGKGQTYLYEIPAFPHALTGLIDENGVRYVTITYNASGLAVSTQLAGGVNGVSLSYDFVNGSTFVTDALNHTTRYDYFTSGGIERTLHVNEPLPGGATGQNSWLYDSNGNIAAYIDFLGNTTQNAYDLTRNLEIQRVLPDGRVVNTTWHPLFRLPVLIQTDTQTDQRLYDSHGNLLQRTLTDTSRSTSRTWKFTYNSLGQELTRTDPNGNVTTETYDAQGNLAMAADPLGHVTKFAHDVEGRLTSVTDPNNLVTTFSYDVRGRTVAKLAGAEKYTYEFDAAGNPTSVHLPSGYNVTLIYDGAHRLTALKDGFGNGIQYALDLTGNRIKETRFDANDNQVYAHSWTYDVLNRLSQSIGAAGETANFTYDANSNLTQLTDPLSNVTKFSYDELSRNFQTTAADGGITQRAYDPLGHLDAVTDPRGLTTSYTVDALGNTLTTTNPDHGITATQSDAAGDIISRTDAKGQVLLYRYDALNRIAQVVRGDTLQVLNSYTYDQTDAKHGHGIGHLTSMADASGSTDWTFDRNGHVIRKVQTIGKRRLTTSYSYDPTSGNLLSMTLPSGAVIHYSSANGFFNNLSLERNGRTTPLVGKIEYEPYAGPRSWTLGNGENDGRTFDQDGRITADGSDNLITYDANSRVTSVTLKGATTGSHSYTYDAVGRLTGLTGSEAQSFAYDLVGNRTQQTVDAQATAYVIDSASNRILSSSGRTEATFVYDTNGSRIHDGKNAYTYDFFGRVTSASGLNGTSSYIYNGQGQRVKKRAARGRGEDDDEDDEDGGERRMTTLFAYDEAGQTIGEYDHEGSAIEETVYLGHMPVAVIARDRILFVHSDFRNTPRQIDNREQEAVWTWDPLAFGETAPQNPGIDGDEKFTYNLRFPGQFFDAESGTNYNYFRTYDPAAGRYLESDPLGLVPGMNTYAYVDNSPLDRVDPTGMCGLVTVIENFLSHLVVSGGVCDWGCVGLAYAQGELYLELGAGTPGFNASVIYSNNPQQYAGGGTIQGGYGPFAAGVNFNAVGDGPQWSYTPPEWQWDVKWGVSATYGFSFTQIGNWFNQTWQDLQQGWVNLNTDLMNGMIQQQQMWDSM